MMEELNTRFTKWSERLGDGFPAAVREGGVLRLWFVGHVADETGITRRAIIVALDRWLADAGPIDSEIDQHLGRKLERLLEERAMIAPSADPYDLACLDMEIGTMYDDTGQPHAALSRYMAAKGAFVDVEAWLDVGIVDMEMGMVATDLGWYSEAAVFLARARAAVGVFGQLDDFARVLIAEATLAGCVGNASASREALEQARWLASESTAVTTMAVATHNLANHLANNGELGRAIEMFTSARNAYEAMGRTVSVADCDKNMGSALAMAGRYAEALDLASGALTVYTDHDHPVHQAHAQRTIAHALHHLGRFDEADASLRVARSIYSDAGQPVLVAACDIDLSSSLRNLMRFDEAAAALRSARAIHDELEVDTDDAWFDDALAAVEQNETDDHTHPESERAA